MSEENYGFTEFRYTRQDIDQIFAWLEANDNSIAATFDCYGRAQTRICRGTPSDWVDIIEQCANARRGAHVKDAQEWWDAMLKRSENHHVTTHK
jgi:hypothetical protein